VKPDAHLPVDEYARKHPVLQYPGETRMLDHLPQLDGIRAIAIVAVMWSHFMPREYVFRGTPPWGAIGVGMFFTLSGFLITRILLNARLKIEDKKVGFWVILKQFYVRRFLRIFPLYYAVLAVLWVTNATAFRDRAAYSLLYLTNYRFSYEEPVYIERVFRRWFMGATQKKLNTIHWDQAATMLERHLWSLSVEEQFYIFWPFLILLCPRVLLLPMMLLTVAAGPVWRTYTYERGLFIHEWMTPGCLDLLGMGAILALLSLPRYNLTRWRDGFVQVCGLIGVPALIALVAQRWWPTVMIKDVATAVSFDWPDYGSATYPVTALASVWLVGMAAHGFRGPIGWFLTCAPVVYVGRISYGLYVVHMLVAHLLGVLFPDTLGDHTRQSWLHFFASVFASLAVASLSWFLLEAPINRLKRYFEYERTDATKSATPAAAA
jgi:peptidoglycan/LPS O-acetylase OafA/YrhL